jgi:hypothetical protein
MTACAEALQEKYRRLFNKSDLTDRESRLAKASAWYLASFGTKKELNKSLLSFGWIMGELLCEIKQCQQVKIDFSFCLRFPYSSTVEAAKCEH